MHFMSFILQETKLRGPKSGIHKLKPVGPGGPWIAGQEKNILTQNWRSYKLDGP